MKAGVETTKDELAKVMAGIKALGSTRVMVGIPSTTAGRNEPGVAINNAELGYIHENGAPEANIPARPFLNPGIAEVQNTVVVPRLRQAGKAALEGQPVIVDKVLNALGLEAVSAVKNKILTGPFVPLAPATLAARRRRGVTRTKPLIDTGQLKNAINYVIRVVSGKKTK